MTQDDIIRMAHQSHIGDSHGYMIANQIAQLTRFAALVASREREECAKIAEGTLTPKQLADQIRARGQS